MTARTATVLLRLRLPSPPQLLLLLVLLQLFTTGSRADITCICSTDACIGRGMTTCIAKSSCYVHYERPLMSSRSVDGEYEEDDDETDESDAESADGASKNAYSLTYDLSADYDDDEAYVTRGCIERSESVRCDNKGPTEKISYPFAYCCRESFCNNVHVTDDDVENDLTEAEDEDVSTRPVTTPWPSLATAPLIKRSTRRPAKIEPTLPTPTRRVNEAANNEAAEIISLQPVYIGLLLSTITVLVLILVFAAVVFKRYHDSRYLPASKVLLFE